MERFEEMCEDGLLGPGDYGLFEDWSAIDGLREAYIRIRDGLVLEREIHEMKDEENFYDDGPYTRPVLVDFSWRTTRWSLIIGGSRSIRRTWSVIASSR